MKRSTTYELYIGVWNPAEGTHTPMLADEFETSAEAKRAAKKIKNGPWWVVQSARQVVATSETAPA